MGNCFEIREQPCYAAPEALPRFISHNESASINSAVKAWRLLPKAFARGIPLGDRGSVENWIMDEEHEQLTSCVAGRFAKA